MLNNKGEICDLLDVSQFLPGKSAYECVAYSAALIKYAGLPGRGPTGTALEASNLAQYWYGREEGSNAASNTNGMSLDQEHQMLGGMGLAWTLGALSVEWIRQSIAEGRPCLVCGAEAGFYDMELGDHVPYNWPPSGNHCIVVSGVAKDGNLLVHDCANVDPSGKVRPGPRVYDASKMHLVSVTSISVPVTPGTPEGWHDDGHTLTAPNGVKVVLGFRQWVLEHSWPAWDVPLEEEQGLNPLEESNPSLGAGTQQVFRATVLEWTPSRGVFVAWVGQELLYLRAARKKLYDYVVSQGA